MEKKVTTGEAQGAKTKSEGRFQFTIAEVKELAENPKTLEVMETLTNDESNKGKTGNYLLTMARAITKQLSLI